MAERRYCSQLNSNETIRGTVDVVDVWLLLEYRAAFGKRVVTENALGVEVSAWLDETITRFAEAGLKARVLFIRQPEIDGSTVTCFVAADQQAWVVETPNYQQLLAMKVEDIISGKQPAKKISHPQYFVCTNGQRDLCCAKFGLPVYLELRQRFSTRVWQTSHVGGHRFAPNVLVLPHGALYGRVYPEVIDGFCEKIEGGKIAFEQFRGRSCYQKPIQAAEAYVGVDGLRLLHVAETAQGFVVQFAGGDQNYSIEVTRSGPYAVKASCAAEPKMAHCWLDENVDAS